MTAPFREPSSDTWPPPFELGPELTAAYVYDARRLRLEAVHRFFLHLLSFLSKVVRL